MCSLSSSTAAPLSPSYSTPLLNPFFIQFSPLLSPRAPSSLPPPALLSASWLDIPSFTSAITSPLLPPCLLCFALMQPDIFTALSIHSRQPRRRRPTSLTPYPFITFPTCHVVLFTHFPSSISVYLGFVSCNFCLSLSRTSHPVWAPGSQVTVQFRADVTQRPGSDQSSTPASEVWSDSDSCQLRVINVTLDLSENWNKVCRWSKHLSCTQAIL